MRVISLLLLLLFPITALAQNAIVGSVQYDYKPAQIWNGQAYVYDYQGKLIARISAAYKVKGVEITTQSSVSLSDIKDVSTLINISMPLP